MTHKPPATVEEVDKVLRRSRARLAHARRIGMSPEFVAAERDLIDAALDRRNELAAAAEEDA